MCYKSVYISIPIQLNCKCNHVYLSYDYLHLQFFAFLYTLVMKCALIFIAQPFYSVEVWALPRTLQKGAFVSPVLNDVDLWCLVFLTGTQVISVRRLLSSPKTRSKTMHKPWSTLGWCCHVGMPLSFHTRWKILTLSHCNLYSVCNC